MKHDIRKNLISNESGKTSVIILLALLVIGGGGYYYLTNLGNSSTADPAVATTPGGEQANNNAQTPEDKFYRGPVGEKFKNYYGTMNLPVRKVGEIFQYSYKRIRISDKKEMRSGNVTIKVTGVKGNQVSYERTFFTNDNKVQKINSTTHIVPFLPPMTAKFDGANEKFTSEFTGNPEEMYPITTKSKTSGKLKVGSTEYDYSCAVTQEETTSIKGRPYPVVVTECKRSTSERRLFFYLPSIGFWARLIVSDYSKGRVDYEFRDDYQMTSYSAP